MTTPPTATPALDSPLAGLLRARNPGARIVADGSADGSVISAVIAIDDHWHSVRIRTRPVAEIYVGLPALDGFAMVVAESSSGWPWRHGDIPFDARYRVTTNDPLLATLWLDESAARAIASLRFDASSPGWEQPLATLLGEPPVIERGWRFEIRGHELAVLKGGVEQEIERYHDAVVAGAVVAAAAHRCGDTWRELAVRVGGVATTSRWDLGGDFAIVCDRRGTTVRIDHVRTRDDEPPEEHRLRTRVRAARVTTRDDAVVAWRRGAFGQPVRVARKLAPLAIDGLGAYAARASSPAQGCARLDAGTRQLLLLSTADALELDPAGVAAWFDGACDDPARLDAAIELCARLAIDDAAHDGPYR